MKCSDASIAVHRVSQCSVHNVDVTKGPVQCDLMCPDGVRHMINVAFNTAVLLNILCYLSLQWIKGV